MFGFALKQGINLCAPPGQFDTRDGSVSALIHDIVDFATKCVERRDGLTPFGR